MEAIVVVIKKTVAAQVICKAFDDEVATTGDVRQALLANGLHFSDENLDELVVTFADPGPRTSSAFA